MKPKPSKQPRRFSWKGFLKQQDIHGTPELYERLHVLKRRIRQLRGAGFSVDIHRIELVENIIRPAVVLHLVLRLQTAPDRALRMCMMLAEVGDEDRHTQFCVGDDHHYLMARSASMWRNFSEAGGLKAAMLLADAVRQELAQAHSLCNANTMLDVLAGKIRLTGSNNSVPVLLRKEVLAINHDIPTCKPLS